MLSSFHYQVTSFNNALVKWDFYICKLHEKNRGIIFKIKMLARQDIQRYNPANGKGKDGESTGRRGLSDESEKA